MGACAAAAASVLVGSPAPAAEVVDCNGATIVEAARAPRVVLFSEDGGEREVREVRPGARLDWPIRRCLDNRTFVVLVDGREMRVSSSLVKTDKELERCIVGTEVVHEQGQRNASSPGAGGFCPPQAATN